MFRIRTSIGWRRRTTMCVYTWVPNRICCARAWLNWSRSWIPRNLLPHSSFEPSSICGKVSALKVDAAGEHEVILDSGQKIAV